MQYIGNKEDWYKSGIYKISNKIDNRVYIGSSTKLRSRYLQHRNKLKQRMHNSKHLQRFCDKYSINTLVFEVIELVDSASLIDKENEYINRLLPAFNSMLCAVLPKGYKHTIQTTEKMSAVGKEAFANGRIIWNKGMIMNEEQKSGYKECSKNIPRIANRVPVYLYNEQGELIKSYTSWSEAIQDTGISRAALSANLRGASVKTKYGIWKRNIL